jgi:PEP-CTERM motif
MKKILVTSFGLLLALAMVSPSAWATDVQFNGSTSTDFNTAANWTPATLPGSNLVDGNFVQNGLTSTYSAGLVHVNRLIVGDTSPGTLLMTGGDLTANINGDDFEIGRTRIPGAATAGSLVDLSGLAILRTAQNSTVGDRDKGVLHVGPAANVVSTAYWRVGNYGPTIDGNPPATEYHGNGLLDVEGVFKARALFIGVDDGTGVVQVRGNGQVLLTQQPDNPGFADIDMDFNHNPLFQPDQSGTIHMIGSTATMSARNLFSQDPGAPIMNKLWFTADSGGVSHITLNPFTDTTTTPPVTSGGAVNITNNALQVDLAGYTVAPGQKLLLVDAAPNMITGTFTNVTITGGGNPANYSVLYDQGTGNISLMKAVPEPSTIVLLGLGAVMAFFATKRRTSR